MHDAIIIGAGPAGMTAAIYCVRKGLDTLVIGKDVGGQIAKSGEIANWLGVGSTTGGELAIQFHNHVEEFKNITHKHGVSVTGITKNDDVFGVTTEEDTYKGKVVIIATGRSPRKLNIPGEAEFTNKGVSYCDVCDGPLFKGKEVALLRLN
jgi:thioredoxin reductase